MGTYNGAFYGTLDVLPTSIEPAPKWELPKLFDGDVVVAATGPSTSRKALAAVRGKTPVVAVKSTHLIAPWAEVLVAHDAAWWSGNAKALAFEGLKICGQDEAPFGVKTQRFADERAELKPGHVVELRSSGLMAIRVAIAAGAKRLLLMGFDGGPWHWHGGGRPTEAIEPAARALEALCWDLQAKGIEVVR